MNIRFLGSVVVGLGVLVAACDQPDVVCQASRRPFATRFTKSGGGGELCAEFLVGNIGIQTFNPASSDPQQPSSDSAFIAVQHSRMKGAIEGAALAYGVGDPLSPGTPEGGTEHQLYSLGDFDSIDSTEGVCTVTSFRAPAQYVSADEVEPFICPGAGGAGGAGGEMGVGGHPCVDDPGLPKLEAKYEWSNMRMLVRADAPGTVFTANLKYTENSTFPITGGDAVNCTTDYTVIALAPSVDCSVFDADGNPTGEGDITLCYAEGDPTAGRPFGSGINPSFGTVDQGGIVDCVDNGGGIFSCVLSVNSVEEVRSKIDAAEE